jgi:anti-anti-sigma factor
MTEESSSGGSRAEEIVELVGLTVCSRRDDCRYTIAVAGEIDVATAGDVEQELLRAEASGAEQIVLDLSGVTFMDSTAIRLLLAADMRSRSNGSRLSLLRPARMVMRVLRIAGVDDVLPFAD